MDIERTRAAAWCLWLIGFAVVLVRTGADELGAAKVPASTHA